jgi:hypothetical protein
MNQYADVWKEGRVDCLESEKEAHGVSILVSVVIKFSSCKNVFAFPDSMEIPQPVFEINDRGTLRGRCGACICGYLCCAVINKA